MANPNRDFHRIADQRLGDMSGVRKLQLDLMWQWLDLVLDWQRQALFDFFDCRWEQMRHNNELALTSLFRVASVDFDFYLLQNNLLHSPIFNEIVAF